MEELDQVVEYFKLDSFHLVGQCEGGVLGIDYAVKFPGRVKTLVVASTQCYSTMTIVEFNRLKLTRKFEEYQPQRKEKFINWHGDFAEQLHDLYRVRGGEYGSGWFDLRPLLPSVLPPVLVMHPDRSSLFGVEQADAIYRGIPNSELAVIPACGHNSYEDRPEEYRRLILDFMKRQDKKLTQEESL